MSNQAKLQSIFRNPLPQKCQYFTINESKENVNNEKGNKNYKQVKKIIIYNKFVIRKKCIYIARTGIYEMKIIIMVRNRPI